MATMSSLPADLAAGIICANAPTHGPIGLFTFDSSHTEFDDDGLHVTVVTDSTNMHMFADNSDEALEDLPFLRELDLMDVFRLGRVGTSLPLYHKVHVNAAGIQCCQYVATGVERRCTLSRFKRALTDEEHLAVFIRSKTLVTAGTWNPTPEELALFDNE